MPRSKSPKSEEQSAIATDKNYSKKPSKRTQVRNAFLQNVAELEDFLGTFNTGISSSVSKSETKEETTQPTAQSEAACATTEQQSHNGDVSSIEVLPANVEEQSVDNFLCALDKAAMQQVEPPKADLLKVVESLESVHSEGSTGIEVSEVKHLNTDFSSTRFLHEQVSEILRTTDWSKYSALELRFFQLLRVLSRSQAMLAKTEERISKVLTAPLFDAVQQLLHAHELYRDSLEQCRTKQILTLLNERHNLNRALGKYLQSEQASENSTKAFESHAHSAIAELNVELQKFKALKFKPSTLVLEDNETLYRPEESTFLSDTLSSAIDELKKSQKIMDDLVTLASNTVSDSIRQYADDYQLTQIEKALAELSNLPEISPPDLLQNNEVLPEVTNGDLNLEQILSRIDPSYSPKNLGIYVSLDEARALLQDIEQSNLSDAFLIGLNHLSSTLKSGVLSELQRHRIQNSKASAELIGTINLMRNLDRTVSYLNLPRLAVSCQFLQVHRKELKDNKLEFKQVMHKHEAELTYALIQAAVKAEAPQVSQISTSAGLSRRAAPVFSAQQRKRNLFLQRQQQKVDSPNLTEARSLVIGDTEASDNKLNAFIEQNYTPETLTSEELSEISDLVKEGCKRASTEVAIKALNKFLLLHETTINRQE